MEDVWEGEGRGGERSGVWIWDGLGEVGGVL